MKILVTGSAGFIALEINEFIEFNQGIQKL